jgi:hypothetical protein
MVMLSEASAVPSQGQQMQLLRFAQNDSVPHAVRRGLSCGAPWTVMLSAAKHLQFPPNASKCSFFASLRMTEGVQSRP